MKVTAALHRKVTSSSSPTERESVKLKEGDLMMLTVQSPSPSDHLRGIKRRVGGQFRLT